MADRRHNKGGASALPTVGCTVAQMAAEYARLAADWDRMDSATFPDRADYAVKVEALDRLGWRMEAVEAGMTAVQAMSIEGALAQLAFAHTNAESFTVHVLEPHQVEARSEAIRRLLYSAISAIAAHHGIDLNGALFARHLPVRLDPFGEVRHVA